LKWNRNDVEISKSSHVDGSGYMFQDSPNFQPLTIQP
jgi:hypothetical protein